MKNTRIDARRTNATVDSRALRGLWLALILMGGTLVATAAGALFKIMGADPVTALGAAGGTFVAAVTLALGAWRFLTE